MEGLEGGRGRQGGRVGRRGRKGLQLRAGQGGGLEEEEGGLERVLRIAGGSGGALSV